MNSLTSSTTEVMKLNSQSLPSNFYCVVDIDRIFVRYTDKLFDSTAEQLGGLEKMCSIAIHLSRSGLIRDMYDGRDIQLLMDTLNYKQLELLFNFKDCFFCLNFPPNFEVMSAVYTYEIRNSYVFASLYLGMAQTVSGFRNRNH